MGEYVVSESINFPFQLVISIVGSILIGAYVSQPNENSDDDDFGNGGGGMMQPVAATGAI